MHKLDLWLLDKLDTFTTKLQRKGWMLTELYVYVAGATLVFNLGTVWLGGNPWMICWVGGIWGAWLFAAIRWANQNKDYPVSVKIMEALNARALAYREDEAKFRFVWWGMLIGFGSGNIILAITTGDYLGNTLSTLGLASPLLMLYLHGCFYIGPGHFARDEQKQLRGDEVLDR